MLGLLPLVFTRPNRGIAAFLIGGILLLFGILDLRLGLNRLNPPEGWPVRVLEVNLEGDAGAEEKLRSLVQMISEKDVDIVTLVECGGQVMAGLIEQLPSYQSRHQGELCLLSRNEIVEWNYRDPKDAWKHSGSAAIASATIRTLGGIIRIGILHPATPRHVLDGYFDLSRVIFMGPATRDNIRLRNDEAAMAREWIVRADSLPLIVAGDFNLPVESAIYKRHWGDFQNAFSAAGRGFGHTKQLRWWGTRIDHVLGSRGVIPVYSQLLQTIGSDHLPLLAEFVLVQE